LYTGKGVVFLRFGRIFKKRPLEILLIGVQAPGLDPGVGEMFRFVGPTRGNRALRKLGAPIHAHGPLIVQFATNKP
jgi:hypothetical protein